MRETKTTNFRIEDAITEAYEQMNEKRKTEIKVSLYILFI